MHFSRRRLATVLGLFAASLFCVALVVVRRLHPDERPSNLRLHVETDYADIFTDVPLTPLSDATSINMVEQLLSSSALPESLRAPIVQKAEGNPFFVEETLKSLVESRALSREDSRWTGWEIDKLQLPASIRVGGVHGIVFGPDFVIETLIVRAALPVDRVWRTPVQLQYDA